MRLLSLISKDVLDVLDENNVYYDKVEYDERKEEFTAEISFTTPKGGDENHIITFKDYGTDLNDKEFCFGLENCFNEFDVNDYVTMWLEAKRTEQRVCPLDAEELVEEAKWIDDFLYKLYKQVEEIV